MDPLDVARCAYLLSLPAELLQQVWTYLQKSDLKSLRLVCKEIEQTVLAALFEVIIFYPHTASIDQLREIAESHVAAHVRHVFYDAAYPKVLECTILAIVNESRAMTRTSGLHEDIRQRAREVCDGFIQHEDPDDHLNLMLSLQRIFREFAACSRLTVLDQIDTMPRYGLARFYIGLLGQDLADAVSALTPEFAAQILEEELSCENTMPIILASDSFPQQLRNFSLYSTMTGPWTLPIEKRSTYSHFRRILGGLDELTLSLSRNLIDMDIDDCDTTPQLQMILKQATNLTKLVLTIGMLRRSEWIYNIDGGAVYTEEPEEICMPTFTSTSSAKSVWTITERTHSLIEPRLTWSTRLKHLELCGLHCTLNEFQQVLGHCSKTLVELKIANLLLRSARHGASAPRACLVKMIKWMQKRLNLDRVSFVGLLMNFGMQCWTVDRNKPGLHQKVAHFVVNGGSCPLDFYEIPDGYFDLGCKDFSTLVPHSFLRRDELGDASWRVRYPIRTQYVEGDEGDEDDLLPGMSWDYGALDGTEGMNDDLEEEDEDEWEDADEVNSDVSLD